MHGELSVTEYFKNNKYYSRIYSLLCEIFISEHFSEKEMLFTLNFLINIATDSAFHFTIEKNLFYEPFSQIYDENKPLSEIITQIDNGYKDVISYIVINNPYFVEMVFLSLYELKSDEKIRSFYFYILNEMVRNSKYNAQLLARETFAEKLFVMLRIEMIYNLKCLIANFLLNILIDHMNISRLKSLIQAMRYNYYWMDVINMFSKLKDETYKANFFDYDNFYLTLKLFFNVLQKINS